MLGKLTLTLTRPAGGQTDSVDGPTTAFGLLLLACVVGVVATDDELMCGASTNCCIQSYLVVASLVCVGSSTRADIRTPGTV